MTLHGFFIFRQSFFNRIYSFFNTVPLKVLKDQTEGLTKIPLNIWEKDGKFCKNPY